MAGMTAVFRTARSFSLGTETGENNEVSTGSRKFQEVSSGPTGFAQGFFTAVA
jgi:hypothetical protein